MKLPYYFTIYGEVFSGEEFFEPDFPDHTIVIQRTKIREYNDLKPAEKNFEKIKEYGWCIPTKCIAEKRELSQEETDEYRGNQPSKTWNSFDRSVMFIFGAGASANCVFGQQKDAFTKDKLRPPLGNTLFANGFEHIYRNYKGVCESLHFLQDESANVETLLEDEWQEVNDYANELVIRRHINIQYYLQELFKTVSIHVSRNYYAKNLYAALADKLCKAHYRKSNFRPSVVSFNQDTILDSFLCKYFDVNFTTLKAYENANQNPFYLFKPHGSWNWGWSFSEMESKSITTAQWLYNEKVNYYQLYFKLLGDYREMIDWHSYPIEAQMNSKRIGKHKVNKSNLSIIYPGNENMYFPALLLPYRDKDEFTMPSSQYWDLHYCIEQAETLVIVGWKGNEFYFNKLLEANGNRIRKLVIADPNPENVKEQLQFLIKKGIEVMEYKGGFEEFVQSGFEKELKPIT